MHFCTKLFNSELVHGRYRGKEFCDGGSPMDSRYRRRLNGIEYILMVGSQLRVDPGCEDLLMFDGWFWCCWWTNRWVFNCFLRLECLCFKFSVETHILNPNETYMFNPLFKGWGKLIHMLLVCCCSKVVDSVDGVSEVRGTSSSFFCMRWY